MPAARVHERGRCADPGQRAGGFPIHGRGLLICRIHRAGHGGIDLHSGSTLCQHFHGVHGFDECIRAVTQMSLKFFDGREIFKDALDFRIKFFRRGKYAFRIPGLILSTSNGGEQWSWSISFYVNTIGVEFSAVTIFRIILTT